MSRPWMPLYVGDYLRDTRRLSTVEHGAYLLLIMEYWTQGGLPDDDKKLARIAGLSVDEWDEVRDNIADLFQPGWKHKRIDAELATAAEKSDAARDKANKRWQAKGNATADAPAMPQHSRGICPDDASHNHSHNHTEGTSVPSDADPREADFRSTISRVYAKHGYLPPETGTAVVWLKQGRDPSICCAIIDDHLAKKRKKLPLSYFEGPIADAHAPPRAGEARPPPSKRSGNGWAEIFRKSNGLGEFAHERDDENGQDRQAYPAPIAAIR